MQPSLPPRLALAAALIAVVVLSVPALGQSSPAPCAPPSVVDAQAVAIPGGTDASDGLQPGPMPAAAPSVCWTAAIGNPVLGAAIGVVGDLVLSSTDTGALVAFGPDGAERWRYQAGETAREVRGLAITPETAFITTSKGVVALALSDGTVRWQFDVPASTGFAGQVPDAIGAFWLTLSGSTLVATTASFGDGENQAQALVAVDAATGSQLWQAPLPAVGTAGTPATDGTIVVVTAGDGTVHALDLTTGVARWTVENDTIGSTVATNLAFSSGMVLAGLGDATVLAVSASDGSVSWHSAVLDPSGGAPSGIAATKSAAYVDTGLMLIAIDPLTGATPWGVTLQQAPPTFPVQAIPAIVGDTIVAGTSDAMDLASLVAVSAAGAELWRAPTDIYGAILSPLVIGGRVYAAAYGIMDGGLLAFGTP